SGSTGRPKGVMVEHRSLSDDIAAARHHYELGASDRVLQFAPASFDPSLEQLLSALASGAAVVVRDGEPWVGRQLLERLRSAGVTVAELTPAYWHTLVAELDAGADLGSLRLLNVGGDVVSREDVAAWSRWASGVRLINTYGPTETAVSCAL